LLDVIINILIKMENGVTPYISKEYLIEYILNEMKL
jgi:hypothetical protein